jgi:hypothetical protein
LAFVEQWITIYVVVWGGICAAGVGEVVLINDNLDAGYIQLLEGNLLILVKNMLGTEQHHLSCLSADCGLKLGHGGVAIMWNSRI